MGLSPLLARERVTALSDAMRGAFARAVSVEIYLALVWQVGSNWPLEQFPAAIRGCRLPAGGNDACDDLRF
jgi:hypothetical protein